MLTKNSLTLNWKTISRCVLAIIMAANTVVSMSCSCWAGETSLPVPIPVRASVAEPTAGVSGLRYSANITPRTGMGTGRDVSPAQHENDMETTVSTARIMANAHREIIFQFSFKEFFMNIIFSMLLNGRCLLMKIRR